MMWQWSASGSSTHLSSNVIDVLHNKSCVDTVTPRVAESNSSTTRSRAGHGSRFTVHAGVHHCTVQSTNDSMCASSCLLHTGDDRTMKSPTERNHIHGIYTIPMPSAKSVRLYVPSGQKRPFLKLCICKILCIWRQTKVIHTSKCSAHYLE